MSRSTVLMLLYWIFAPALKHPERAGFRTLIGAVGMLKFVAITVVTCMMLVVGFGYETNANKSPLPIDTMIDANSTLASRYPLRARTPDFFGRSKGRTTSQGRYRA